MDIVHVEVTFKHTKTGKIIKRIVTRSALTFSRMKKDIGVIVRKCWQVTTVEQYINK